MILDLRNEADQLALAEGYYAVKLLIKTVDIISRTFVIDLETVIVKIMDYKDDNGIKLE